MSHRRKVRSLQDNLDCMISIEFFTFHGDGYFDCRIENLWDEELGSSILDRCFSKFASMRVRVMGFYGTTMGWQSYMADLRRLEVRQGSISVRGERKILRSYEGTHEEYNDQSQPGCCETKNLTPKTGQSLDSSTGYARSFGCGFLNVERERQEVQCDVDAMEDCSRKARFPFKLKSTDC